MGAVRRLLLAAALAAAFATSAGPAAARLTPADLASTGVAPPPAARLPAGLRFVDQDGRDAVLAPVRAPVLLLFADYSCKHLCGPGVTLTAGALHDAGLVAGRDYAMIVIGLDGDGPAAARALRDTRLRGLDAEARAMRLLTGSPATVAAAERALGYHAVYDAEADQFAHDAALFLFARDGRLSAVLPETATTPMLMRRAIAQAAGGTLYVPPAPGAIERLVAICYGLAAAHGIYGQAVVAGLRAAALATVAVMGIALWRLSRRRAAAR